MIKNSSYIKQADLLLNVIPFILKEKNFALKGGTAINFFIRNMPRLSVDIDLAYLVINDRKSALKEINDFLIRISNVLKKSYPGIAVEFKKSGSLNEKLFVRFKEATIKIEPNTILRGCVFPAQILHLCEKAKKDFEKDIMVQSLSLPDLYGSKICAALDRQHPRDLFDVKLLFENEGFTDEIRKAFIIYLISHPRPISELLNPNLKDFKDVYENEFTGMTNEEILYDHLIATRDLLIKTILKDLTASEREFLLSFKNIKPDWKLMDLYKKEDQIFNIKRIQSLPAIKWKLLNLKKMEESKHRSAYNKLKRLLDM